MARIIIDHVERPIVVDNIEDVVLFVRTAAGYKKEILATSEEFLTLSLARLNKRVEEMYLEMTFDSLDLE